MGLRQESVLRGREAPAQQLEKARSPLRAAREKREVKMEEPYIDVGGCSREEVERVEEELYLHDVHFIKEMMGEAKCGRVKGYVELVEEYRR